jgi:hypothetical protein
VNPFRVVAALLGFLAAILGIARGDTTIVWVAIGLLGSSLAARIFLRIQERRRGHDAADHDD